jgi:hypothetical protein
VALVRAGVAASLRNAVSARPQGHLLSRRCPGVPHPFALRSLSPFAAAAVIAMGIDFFQVLAIFSDTAADWAPPVKALFHILSAFNINVEIVAPDCIIPGLTFEQKFAFIMLMPICVGLLLLGVFLYLAAWKVRTSRTAAARRRPGAEAGNAQVHAAFCHARPYHRATTPLSFLLPSPSPRRCL